MNAIDGSEAKDPIRQVHYEYSSSFPRLLSELGITLLVSTYQAGKLVVIGTRQQQITLSIHNFDQAMGVAVHPARIAVGTRTQVWFLEASPDIARQLRRSDQQPSVDACYIARASHVTDEIQGHEMCWCGDQLWLVNTRFSCLCTIDKRYSFVPRWRPPFVSQLLPEDRCHLNGLAIHQGRPVYVTAMAETDTAAGWRQNKAETGCLIDVATGQTVARGFAMPHSPRVHGGQVWLLDSGRGQMVCVDPMTANRQVVTSQPGYTRGLDFVDRYAFIGLSKIRETSTFGGVPIAEKRDTLKCGVAIVDVQSGRHLAHFEFTGGVDELFDVRVLPQTTCPKVVGPLALVEGDTPIWYAPLSGEIPTSLSSASPTTAGDLDRVADGLQRPAQPSSSVNLVRTEPAARSAYERGIARAEQDDLVAAEALFRQAIEADGQFAAAHCNLGVALHLQGRLPEATAALEQALQLDANLASAHWHLALTRFLAHDFAAGWKHYEWRWKCAELAKQPSLVSRLAPTWQGQSLAGKSIAIYGEQGIGDEIMFASTYQDVIESAERVALTCRPRLVPLYRRSFPDADVFADGEWNEATARGQIGPIDYQVAAGSLLRWTRPLPTVERAATRFLRAAPEHVERWRRRLESLRPDRLIGISWRGGRAAPEIRRRSTSLADWTPVLATPGVQFVNLQYGLSADERTALTSSYGVPIHDWPDMDPLSNMDDLAAVMKNLDLVISVDNSTVHLAGALGVSTWVLLSFPGASHWRWQLDGERCVWYRSLKLWRTPAPRQWGTVMRAMATALNREAPA